MKKVLLVAFIICKFSVVHSQWEQVESPRGISVNKLYNHSDTLYAGTSNGVYLHGSTGWEKLDETFNTNVTGILVHSGYLYASSSTSGIFRSSNKGKSWVKINNNLNSPYVNSIESHKDIIVAGTSGGIYISEDNGLQWIDRSSNLGSRDISEILSFNDFIIAGGSNPYNGGVFLSSDGGTSWATKNSGLESKRITSLISVGTNLLVSTADKGIFISTDNASTWEPINQNLSNKNINTIFYHNDTLFAASTDSLYYSTDLSEISWTGYKSEVISQNAQTITFWNANIIVGNSIGVYSENVSFQDFNKGFPGFTLEALYKYDTLFYISTNKGIWYKGITETKWNYSKNVPGNSFKRIDKFNDTTHVMYNNTGVYISNDPLKSWQLKYANTHISCIALLENVIFIGTNSGVYRSSDRGNNWLPVNVGLESSNISALYVSDNYLFVTCQGFNIDNESNAKRLYRTASLGDEWEKVDNLTYGYQDICVYKSSLYRAYSNNHLYQTLVRSDDYGVSWKEVFGKNYLNSIKSPYNLYSLDSLLFSFSDNTVSLSMNDSDTLWYRLSKGYSNSGKIKGIVNHFNDLYIWDNNSLWTRKLDNLYPPISPSKVEYFIDEENILHINWQDNSNNETSFVIRRYHDFADIHLPANSTSALIDLDTVTYTFSFPFYLYANNNGDFSELIIAVEKDVAIDDNDDDILNIDFNDNNKLINIYPNPTKDYFNISISNDKHFTINVYNLSGLLVKTNHIRSRGVMDLSDLDTGVYILVTDLDGIRERYKVIKY